MGLFEKLVEDLELKEDFSAIAPYYDDVLGDLDNYDWYAKVDPSDYEKALKIVSKQFAYQFLTDTEDLFAFDNIEVLKAALDELLDNVTITDTNYPEKDIYVNDGDNDEDEDEVSESKENNEINEAQAFFRKILDPKTHAKVKKWFCPKGFKIVKSGSGRPQCQKMNAQEMNIKRKAAIKAARARKAKTAEIIRKRQKTLKMKKSQGL